MHSTTLTIGQIEVSPLNVRTYGPDADDTAALEASILADGQLNPIAVHPWRGPKGKFAAIAGGRRTRAIARLVERGDLPADFAVKAVVHEGLSDAELIELSITENLIRKDLRDHELFAGVARAAAKGHDVAQIAAGLGNQAPEKVARWLRLGRLAPPIFEAFVAEVIDEDRARAYAATEDQALQLLVFEQMSKTSWHGSAADIRREMKVGDRDLISALRFVGEDAYRAAGGRFELDLFADNAEQRGRVVDEGILRRLLDEKLKGVRDETRAAVNAPDLRFVVAPPDNGYGGRDFTLQVDPKRHAGKLPAGEIVAHIDLDRGEPQVTFWWASRSAKHGSTRTAPVVTRSIGAGAAIGQQYDGSKQAADAAIREEEGLSADSVQVFRSLRQAVLRGLLIADARAGGDVGQDLFVFCQARMLLGEARPAALGMRAVPAESYVGVGQGFDLAKPHVDASEAGRTIDRATADLIDHPWMTEPDLVAAFRDYRAAPVAERRLAAAVVAGLALERSLAADGYRVPLHDFVGQQLSEWRSPRELAEPTAELLALLPTRQRLEIAEPFVEPTTHAAWGKLKSADLTARMHELLTGAGGAVRTAMKDAAARWVHPLLRFGEDDDDGGSAFVETEQHALEAAE